MEGKGKAPQAGASSSKGQLANFRSVSKMFASNGDDRSPNLARRTSTTQEASDSEIELLKVRRKFRTVKPTVPEEVSRQRNLPPHIQHCLNLYQRQYWSVVDLKEREKYGRGDYNKKDLKADEIEDLKYECLPGHFTEEDVLAETSVAAHFAKSVSAEEHRSRMKEIDEHEHQVELFKLSWKTASLPPVDDRPSPVPLSEFSGYQISIEMKELTLEVDDIDVFYGSVALYRLPLDKNASRGRISEMFHFTLTESSRWGSEMDVRPGPISPESLSRRALFTIDKPHPNICAVFRFEKILWGEQGHATDFYARGKIKPKEYLKLRGEGQDCAKRLGKYTQSFVCAAVNLFPDGADMSESPKRIVLDNLTRLSGGDMSDDVVFTEVRALLGKGSVGDEVKGFLTGRSRRLKPLPGKFVIEVQKVKSGERLPNRVTTGLIPVDPFSNSSSAKIIREIQQFSLDAEESPNPWISYVHHLYVYPEMINMTRYQGPSKGRNLTCTVQLKVDDVDETPPGLPVLHGRAAMANFVSAANTNTQYHEQRPRWFEEFVFQLPPDILPNHHLLVTFHHVNIAPSKKAKKGQDKVEEEAAYAWLRVLDSRNCVIADGEHELPVAIELPQRYLSADDAEVKWVDKQRELFTMRSRLVSSLMPHDTIVSEFFRQFSKSTQSKEWNAVVSILQKFGDAGKTSLVQFLPVLFNMLFSIVGTCPDDIAVEAVRSIFLIIEKVKNLSDDGVEMKSKLILTSYISTIFENPDTSKSSSDVPFDIRLLQFWRRYVLSEPKALIHSWFFFNVIVKSRIELLARKKYLPFSTASRKEKEVVQLDEQLREEVIDSVEKLIQQVLRPSLDSNAPKVPSFSSTPSTNSDRSTISPGSAVESEKGKEKERETGEEKDKRASSRQSGGAATMPGSPQVGNLTPLAPGERSSGQSSNANLSISMSENGVDRDSALYLSPEDAMEVNKHLALFVKDLIPLVSTTSMVCIVLSYTSAIDSGGAYGTQLTEAKYLFLRVLASYENFIKLNEAPEHLEIGDVGLIMTQWAEKHVFSSLLCAEGLMSARMQHKLSEANKSNPIISRGIDLLYDTLLLHSNDDRFSSPAQRARVAYLYFPYVLGLIEDERSNHILTVSVRSRKVSADDIHKILICFLWIVRNLGADFLHKWIKKEHDSTIIYFFLILSKALDFFEVGKVLDTDLVASLHALQPRLVTQDHMMLFSDNFDPVRQGLLRSALAMDKKAVSDSVKSHKKKKHLNISSSGGGADSSTSSAPGTPGSVRKFRQVQENGKSPTSEIRGEDVRTKQELALLHEASLVCARTLIFLMVEMKDRLNNAQDVLMARVVSNFVLLLLKKNQSEQFLSLMYALLQYFTVTFSKPLFSQETPYCGDLTFELMRHCNFRSAKTRGEAAGCLYLFYKTCWQVNKNLLRMKLQSSVALAKLVGDSSIRRSRLLESGLKNIVKFSATDKEMDSTFKAELEDLLAQRLSQILANVNKLEKWQHDPEMYADVMYETSLGWRDSPDIRFHWLEALAKQQQQNSSHEEAAQCRIHVAALIMAHVDSLKPELSIFKNHAGRRPVLLSALKRASPNVEKEFVVDCTPTAVAEGMCCSATFSTTGIQEATVRALESLQEASLHETAIDVQQLLVFILRQNRRWNELGSAYDLGARWCTEIVDSDKTNRRLFSNFYRINFFGKRFERLNGQAMVYKELGSLRLADLTDRLRTQYEQQFSSGVVPGKVTILPNTWVGDSSEMEAKEDEVFLQIASVLPYLTKEDLKVTEFVHKSRPSPWERCSNLNRFIYEKPYAINGKSLKDAGTDEMGKIKTILTTECPFPFVVKRILVTEKVEIKLSPIETNIEIMEDRIQKLKIEYENEYPNPKTLQIVLQGSVLLQVNAGPLEIARVFLGDNESQYDVEDVKRLRQLFADFIVSCKEALRVNAEIIKSDQKDFHTELEKGFEMVQKEVKKYVKLRKKLLGSTRSSSKGDLLSDSSGGSPRSRRSVEAVSSSSSPKRTPKRDKKQRDSNM